MPETRPILFRGARVVDPAGGFDRVTDVLVTGGVIAGVGEALGSGDAETIECSGLVLTPGLVDLHAHLREPGFEQKETIQTGTRAAAVGGFTAVSSMANTDPVTDHAAIVMEIREKAAAARLADVFPVGAITKGLRGESIAELGEMVQAGVRVFSDDGHCVPTARILRNALMYAKAFPHEVVIADHCEDPSLVEGGQMHEGVHSFTLGLAGRPAEAEEMIVARDLAMARAVGGRLHICHVSSARSVDLIRRAKAEGIRVSAEVTPHHLVFTDDDLDGYDTNFKVNPPVRAAEDRDALRAGLADGTIGLETALAAVLTHLVGPGLLTLQRAIEAFSTVPARILGAGAHGGPIEPGKPANLTVFDPREEWFVEPPFASKARNSAFMGSRFTGRVRYTLLRGDLTVSEGKATR